MSFFQLGFYLEVDFSLFMTYIFFGYSQNDYVLEVNDQGEAEWVTGRVQETFHPDDIQENRGAFKVENTWVKVKAVDQTLERRILNSYNSKNNQ
tara:strand:- start:218 stop:499 length:282 start_codon:yes stop_codon:yes gene_type:complete